MTSSRRYPEARSKAGFTYWIRASMSVITTASCACSIAVARRSRSSSRRRCSVTSRDTLMTPLTAPLSSTIVLVLTSIHSSRPSLWRIRRGRAMPWGAPPDAAAAASAGPCSADAQVIGLPTISAAV